MVLNSVFFYSLLLNCLSLYQRWVNWKYNRYKDPNSDFSYDWFVCSLGNFEEAGRLVPCFTLEEQEFLLNSHVDYVFPDEYL